LHQTDDKTTMICTACRECSARTLVKQDAAVSFVINAFGVFEGCANFRRWWCPGSRRVSGVCMRYRRQKYAFMIHLFMFLINQYFIA